MRARASSFPWPWCLASRSSPPIARPAARRCSRSARVASHSSHPVGVQASCRTRLVAPVSSAISSSSSGRSAPTITPVTPGRHDAAGLPLLADARRRAHQRALQQRLVGHRRDRLLACGRRGTAPGCAPASSAKPRLRHRLDVVVVRRAAHAADVRGAVAGGCRRASPCTSSVIFTVRPLNTSKSAVARRRDGRTPGSSAAATSGSSVPRGGRPIGSHPSQSSAHSAVFFGPTDANQIGMSDGGCRIDFSGLPCPSAPGPGVGQRDLGAVVGDRSLAAQHVAEDLDVVAQAGVGLAPRLAVPALDDLRAGERRCRRSCGRRRRSRRRSSPACRASPAGDRRAARPRCRA